MKKKHTFFFVGHVHVSMSHKNWGNSHEGNFLSQKKKWETKKKKNKKKKGQDSCEFPQIWKTKQLF